MRGVDNGDAAATHYFEVVTGTFNFKASGRAMTLNATDGFIKAVADAETKLLLGVVAVGRGVSELIGEATLALEMGAFLEDVGLTIHPHPTMSEALQGATEKIREGVSLTAALESTGMLEALPLEMVKVGEQTGALGDMLEAISDFYDEELDTRMAAVLSLVPRVVPRAEPAPEGGRNVRSLQCGAHLRAALPP